MNKIILDVINRANLTRDELRTNAITANNAVIDVKSDACANAAYIAYASVAYDKYTDSAGNKIDSWLDEYFQESGEDKQLYLGELAKLNNE